MNMKLITPHCLILLTTITLFLSNCTSTRSLNYAQLTGTWQEQEPEGMIQMAGSTHRFTFYEDRTFHLEQQRWTDAITAGDPCGFSRTDHLKGRYKIKNGVLKLSGKYYDAQFENPKPNCKNEVNFKKEYVFKLKAEQLLLNADSDQAYRQILLIR